MSIAKKIHSHLIEQEKTLALAESCTGGELATKFTIFPDASQYFLGSIVSYSNALKKELLQVSANTLQDHGAVSRETANEMLLGLMKFSSADYGIAITGIAGPSGGTDDKPVGTVFIALGEKGKKPHVIRAQFTGDRKNIIDLSCNLALEELGNLLIG